MSTQPEDPSAAVPLPTQLPYRLLSGTDDEEFCRKVSRAMADGYRLHGSPSVATDADGRPVVVQAVVLAAGVDQRGELR